MTDASTNRLRHFWFEFVIGWDGPFPHGVREGVGVTDLDEPTALERVRRDLFEGVTLPPIRRVIVDVETTDLCPWLVLPNMCDWETAGVWFPVRPTAYRAVRWPWSR